MIDCTTYLIEDYPELKKGMTVRLYNGVYGIIESVELGKYFRFEDSVLLHISNIRYIY